MSDVVDIGRRVTNVNISPQFDNYSKVIIHVSDETSYEVGNDTGRTLEITNPFGTQEMAENILSSLSGYQYQPYTADGALLDPAAEVGDAVNVRGAYGGIYTREKTFGRLMKSDISAPQDEEINHEYAYESPERREFKRSINDVKASLIIANDRIDASVTRTGGSEESFGWSLQSDAHRWYANGQEVMAVTASGLIVNGMVNAQNGTIANFTIGEKVVNGETVGSANAIWNNISRFGGTQTNGVYLGTDGIQLGQAFKVTSSGQVTASNISANNMTLTGTLKIGGKTIEASDLRVGAQSAFDNRTYWSGGASGGYSFTNATTSQSGQASNFWTDNLRANRVYANTYLYAASFQYGSTMLSLKTKTISGVTINYLGY